MPKIIITGRNFTEPDDGALQMLKNAGYEVIDLGKLGMAHGTPEKEVAEAVKDADAVIAGLEPYTEGVLSVCPKLKLISRRGIGYDSVDVEACHRHGVTLCRTQEWWRAPWRSRSWPTFSILPGGSIFRISICRRGSGSGS